MISAMSSHGSNSAHAACTTGASRLARSERVNGPDLRPEDEHAVPLRVVEGFLAQPVARQNQPRALRVPEGEGEHPVEVGDAFLPELLPRVNDDLGVGPRREAVAPFPQAGAELAEV